MIKKLKTTLNNELKSIYDYNDYTLTELLCKFLEKINCTIDQCNLLDESYNYLLNQGLAIETKKELEIMYNDGRLQTMLNDILLKKLDNRSCGELSILDYEEFVLNKNTEEEDWSQAIKKAIEELKNNKTKNTLIFPSGIYQYSETPNFAIDNVKILPQGEVRFRYTGQENAVDIDSGEIKGLCWNMEFGEFIIECPSTAKNGLFVRGTHASTIKAKILGAGVEYSGLRVEWCVCTDFYVKCTSNHEGWYKDSKPKYGIYLDKREYQTSGGYTSWCTFYSPIVEHTEIGLYIARGQGCSFIGGTFEGCTDTGIHLSNSAIYNKFYNCDMEENTNYDVYCLGRENDFYSIDTTNTIKFDEYARDNVITGGSHNNIIITATSYSNIINSVRYNRFNNDATLNDESKRSRLINNRNVGKIHVENMPPYHEVLTTTSPYTFTNNYGNDVNIVISGGEVTKLMYIKNGYGVTFPFTPIIRLNPNDKLQITYTGDTQIILFST